MLQGTAPSLAAPGLAAVDKEGKPGFRDLSGFRGSYVAFAVRDNHSFFTHVLNCSPII